MSTGTYLLADLAPESSGGPANVAVAVGVVVVVVAAVAVLARVRRRRASPPPENSDHSTLAVLALLPVVADAAPGGYVLIGFLVFVLVLFGIFIALVVLAIIGIRRWLRGRAARQESQGES